MLPRPEPKRPVAAPPATNTDDAVLVAGVRADNEAAFEAIYRAHFVALCQFASRYVQTPESAEEVVQDVLWQVWEQRSTFSLDRGGTLRSYLFAAVRNKAINAVKRHTLEARWQDRWRRDTDAAPLGTAERLVDAIHSESPLPDAIDRALGRLSEQRRTLVRLRWQQGLSYAEIASVLGISVKGVDVAVSRILRTLRASLPR